MRTLVELLERAAATRPDDRAYVYLEDGIRERGALTIGQLYDAARAIGSQLLRRNLMGERALLVFPAGLDFVKAFFGCLFAGVVAVPVPAPRASAGRRSVDRLRAVADDADARIVLTSSTLLEATRVAVTYERIQHWLLADTPTDDDLATWWRSPGVLAGDTAYLQYTSGSTSAPRGVVVSHDNVLATVCATEARTEISPNDVNVTWLPHFHDMGLVDGLLQSMYSGHLTVLMSPQSFVKRPVRWLQALSKYRGTRSGAPNFAYDECVDSTTEDERRALNLATWRTAYCGSELVRAATLARFHEAFAPAGLRRSALRPSYGLAEATLCVSTTGVDDVPRAVPANDGRTGPRAEGDAGSGKRARSYVECGAPLPGVRVEIVDPNTGARRPDGSAGEIWVAGRSVCARYWNSGDSGLVFGARVEGDPETCFLRTGDLGLFWGDRLVITGRLKDLIIVGGRNVHAEDVELTVSGAHHATRDADCVAFSVDDGVAERLVVIVALSRQAARSAISREALVGAIHRAVSEEHGVGRCEVAFVRASAIPRTSSGKLQRQRTRAAYVAGELEKWPWVEEVRAVQVAPCAEEAAR